VRVDVDEARRDEQTAGVELLAAAAGDLPDNGDDAARDGDVGLAQGAPGTVRDRPAADDEIVFAGHHSLP